MFRPLLAALVVAGAFGMDHRAIASPVAPSEAETQPALDTPVAGAAVDSSLPMPDLGRVRLADANLDATLDASLDTALSEPSPVADLESAPATTDLLEVSPELSPEVEPLEAPSTLPPEMDGASSAADLSASEITSEAIAIPVDMLLSGTLPVDVSPAMAQVTSVQQFSDVQPSDWAYEALAYLANSEAEGGLDCLEGYPDGTFRGGRAMTRYEFAAGLASCLDAVVGRLDSLDPEALARIEALQREFAAELAVLRGRVDALEEAVAALEANQFSTTTVLRGNAWMNLTQAFPDGRILTERNPFAPNAFAPPIRDANGRPSRVFRDQPQLTFSYFSLD
ncbi:iron uptake porin [Thermoleptolyngbya sichuanensis]|uniref:iron uptake porin n=1 Tax=Thermoleptolyngbya sichuanensis TaxID=2885951 RepID=UPI0028F425A9|nr:iron uptake porin [Thermoleptolyngbya sichuanensis]